VVKNSNKKYNQLRKEFEYFIFESFTLHDSDSRLSVIYKFNLSDKYFFFPEIHFIKGKNFQMQLSPSQINNFVFHIGLIELISYWKAACSPRVIIKPFHLNEDQIEWWKNLWFHGLGEFFYMNNLNPGFGDFLTISSDPGKTLQPFNLDLDRNKVLIPVGGGKDSAVTLELLKPHFECIPFMVNPREAGRQTIYKGGFGNEDFFEVRRNIHPQLIRLNELGFLNGHTPFSALLAFVSVFAAALSGARSVALSNESSANEPTDPESGANHQYSKTFTFERDFRHYLRKYISGDINYFSFLRPVNEFAIASLFSKHPNYFSVFKSCNVGSKSDSWCCKCPKCLFTFIILSPHLSPEILKSIFGVDLLDDDSLMVFLLELTGMAKTKPFECVGTIDEVNYALVQSVERRKDKLPVLLKQYCSTMNYKQYRNYQREELTRINIKDHFLEDDFMKILKAALHD
jgi:hypothetical protein